MRRLAIAIAVLVAPAAGLLVSANRQKSNDSASTAPSTDSVVPVLAVGDRADEGMPPDGASGERAATAGRESTGPAWRAKVKVESFGTAEPVPKARVHLVLDRTERVSRLLKGVMVLGIVALIAGRTL